MGQLLMVVADSIDIDESATTGVVDIKGTAKVNWNSPLRTLSEPLKSTFCRS